MYKSGLLYSGRIVGVKFSLSGTEEVKKDSYAVIDSHEMYDGNVPYKGGVYDARLGTTDHSYKCDTCNQDKRHCLGHPGSIMLNYPVWNPMAVQEGRKWLRLICFKCGHPIIKDDLFMSFPARSRLDEASKIARSGIGRKCIHCKEPHPSIKKNASEPLALWAECVEDKRVTNRWIIYPHIAGEIFNRISDQTVIKLGKKLEAHPRHFILHAIQVPAVTIRPDIKSAGGKRIMNDSITSLLQMIIKTNSTLPPVLPAEIDQKLTKSIFELSNIYYDMIKANNDKIVNFPQRLKGKEGRARQNQLGKRAWLISRSTIIGDPNLKIDEVGVPLTFARKLPIIEQVQEFNKKRLLALVQNGTKKYPGASAVIKYSTGTVHSTDSAKEIELEIGDIVCRDMMDGDPVDFNRQPSLTISNISAHKAKIIMDDSVKTNKMNVIATPLYNADFDGDQMNGIVCAEVASRNEMMELGQVANWLISHTTSAPSMGQVDDSIIGLAELTRSNVRFDKYHAMLIFRNTTFLPDFRDAAPDGTFTGRDLISKLLAETPVNFTRATEWYKPNMAAHLKYDPTEIKVNIERGRHVSGVLDKKSIGKGADGGLYHVIANEYGNKKALEVMFNMQQMAIAYILQFGFTIGIMDLIIPMESKREIDLIAADIINKSKLKTEELNHGEIIPPIGETVEGFFERNQIAILSIFDDFAEPILKGIDPDANNLFKLIMFGSKGKMEQMFNMVSAVGQKLINGERIRQKFGFKRTLAYFPRYDTSPESRGYITNSYLSGMNSSEYTFNAQAARFDLISKSLSTAVTGEQNRKSIKNLESQIVNNFRWVLKGLNVIQFAYGEDFLDPRKVERVSFPTVMISDEAFEKAYRHKDYPEFFDAMLHDRRKYRERFFAVERMNVKELLTDTRRMPVNIERIINDVCRGRAAGKDLTAAELQAQVRLVESTCRNLPYILINEIQEQQQTPIPEHISAAAWLVTMLMRSHLHPRALEQLKLSRTELEIIIERIRLRYIQALIDPGTAVGIIAAQSFSEPLTQYLLDAHHRSASGGTSKSSMTKSKEVLGAKDVDKLESPSMLITLLPEYYSDKAKVQEIANNIEMMDFRQFVTLWQIFFEKYGEPVHSQYKHEAQMIADFNRRNPLMRVPGNLIKWCIRFVLNKATLILKNMALETIVTKLRETFPEIYIVYTPENVDEIILRVYMRNTLFKSTVTVKDIKKLLEAMLNTIIRGVAGITAATVTKMIRNKINPDGSISRDNDQWGITTTGTNLKGVFGLKYIDKINTHTDAIQEVYRMLGIEAARQKVISELRNLVDVCNHRHYLIYADEMTFTGRVTSIESSGLKARETSNVLLRIGFSSPISVMEEAAVNCMEDKVTGITAPLLVGSIPRHGTLYNSFHVNEKFVRENVPKPEDILETLY